MSRRQVSVLDLGAELLEICSDASSELILAAPFVKAGAFQRVLSVVHPIVEVTLITRWRVEEIHAGVSDLEVWDLLDPREKSNLLLIPTLHAKYYRADSRCWIGSANLTQTALGWTSNPNLELMIEVERGTPGLENFEQVLLERSFPATPSLVEELKRLLDSLPPPVVPPLPDSVGGQAMEAGERWIPALRHPEQLFLAYSGDTERLTAVSRRAALEDLVQIRPPGGLSESEFNAVVAFALLQSEILRLLDGWLTEPRRFGSVTEYLRRQLPAVPASEIDHMWQTLMRWVSHFLPTRYEISVPNYTEVIRRTR